MRLTTYTDYSIRVLIRLALNPQQLTTIASIAEIYDISEHHLMKVVHQLGIAGYVETVRGRGGGLRLAMKPSAIKIGQVVRRMESDFDLVACFRGPKACAIAPACLVASAFEEALKAFMAVLDRYTLADVVRKPRKLCGLLGIPVETERLRLRRAS